MLGTKFLDTPNLLINANEKKNMIKKILRQQRELSCFQEAGPAFKFASLPDLLRKYLMSTVLSFGAGRVHTPSSLGHSHNPPDQAYR